MPLDNLGMTHQGSSGNRQPLEITVVVGRLQYVGEAVPGMVLEHDPARRAWIQRDPNAPAVATNLAPVERTQAWSRVLASINQCRVPVLPAAAAFALALLIAVVVSRSQSAEEQRAVLPPPVPEQHPEVPLEAVPAPYRAAAPDQSPSPLPAAPFSATQPLPPLGAEPAPERQPPVQLPKPSQPAAPVAAATRDKQPVGSAKAKQPVGAKDAAAETHVVFDEAAAASPGRTAAPAQGRSTPAQPTPATQQRPAGKLLLAIPSEQSVVVTDPGTRLPTQVKVGSKLPNGATLLSANPSTGVANTDKGPLRLE